MNRAVEYRLMRAEDSPALEAIMTASPDAGLVQFSYDYQKELVPVQRVLSNDLQGVVALVDGTPVGMFLGDVTRVQWAGEVHPAVYLSNLRVHPDYRRGGVARGMSEWGLSYLGKLFGEDYILYAAIMERNQSLALAQEYGFQSSAAIQGGAVPVRSRPPQAEPGLTVRLAAEDDLSAIAEGMNHFYRQHDLWSPVSEAGLKRFVDQQVADVRPNQLFVVARGDLILGGLSLSDRTGLVRMRIASAPAFVRLLGNALGVLPKSGVMRALTVRRVWFRDGELQAGRYLWQLLRYQLRERGDSLGIAYDPRSPLAGVFQIPFWLPMFKARYLVRAGEKSDRLIYCLAGP